MKRYVVFLTILAVASLVSGPTVADEGPQSEAPETSVAIQEAQLPVGAGGAMVFIDPETGRVTGTPTAEQRAALQVRMADLFNQSDEGTYDEYLPNGAVLRDLQGRLMSATMVRIAPDGSQHQECSTSLVNSAPARELESETDAAAPAGGVAK